MAAWTLWTELGALGQVYLVLGLPCTLLFLLSSLLPGLGGADADFAGGSEALEFLGLRTLLAFGIGFGWGGLLFVGSLGLFSLPLALLAGLGFAWTGRRLTGALNRLQSSGTADPRRTIGLEGRVSVQVDPDLGGLGKVVVRLRERELELLAASEDATALRRGERVQVYGVADGHLLVSREDRLGLGELGVDTSSPITPSPIPSSPRKP